MLVLVLAVAVTRLLVERMCELSFRILLLVRPLMMFTCWKGFWLAVTGCVKWARCRILVLVFGYPQRNQVVVRFNITCAENREG